MHKHIMKYASAALAAISCLVMSLQLVSCTTTGGSYYRNSDGEVFPPDKSVTYQAKDSEDGTLRILTLNIAHGRNQAANQLLLDKQDIEKNLVAIAQVLQKTEADVVALQEADGPSGWSGNFDHIEFLARKAGYPWYYRADHAESWLFSYGTAILSRLPVSEILQHSFKPSLPTFNKGFLLTRVHWNHDDQAGLERHIDIVSVHLDFSRQSVREEQIAELTEVLSGRDGPMIVLGDFNSEWFSDKSVVKSLAENAKMSVYRHDANDQHTYNNKYRYDWILISNDLAFVEYQVLPDLISDHRAVLAEIKWIAPTAAYSDDRH
ncbi:MAG: endonuclease/exonuclease/phosphatase family protein [Thiotrichales bacterium]|nr:MAG: endonuclease/exonuclease/phosphatase family protein [Thiotrichales bacterium]